MVEDLNIIGNWNAIIETPFGESKATVSISAIDPAVCGTVVGENGSFSFDSGSIINGVLRFVATVDTPIRATLRTQATIESDSFFGILMIDDYMKVNIRGNKNVNI